MKALDEIWAKLHGFLTANGADLPAWIKAAGVLAGSAVAWVILRRLIGLLERKTKSYEFIRSNSQVFDFLRQAIFYLLVLSVGILLIDLFRLPLVDRIFHALLIVVLAKPVVNFSEVALYYMEKRIADRTQTKLDNIILDLLNKFAGVVIFAVAAVMALDVLGLNVMPFVAGAGVAGIAVGFAAKDTLSNLIAGVLLIIDRPFEIGDRIEVWSAPAGSATWGDVINIGLRATKIKTTDNIIIIIPNNEIMKRDIVNYTLIDTAIRVRINVGVSYEADIDKAKEIIIAVADTAPWISREPPPKVVVRNFGNSSVDLQVRVWIQDARRRMETISFMTDCIKAAFDREGIEIPYPKRDITVTQKITADSTALSRSN